MQSTRHQVWLRCGDCGDAFAFSANRARVYRREGREPVCRDCRRPKLSEAEQAKLRAWWLNRYSTDELQEIGQMIWPDKA